MKFSDMQRDMDAINEGRWVKDIPDLADVELKVRGQTSTAYRDALTHNVASLTRDKRDAQGRPLFDQQFTCIAEALFSAVLLDWKNLEDDQGKPIKYSRDLAHKWLTDPDLVIFRNGVIHAASLVDQTRPAKKE